MWGIGIKKVYDVKGEYVSVKDSIYNEHSLVKKFLVILGIPFQIWEKKYDSNHTVREERTTGFNK